MVSVVGHPAADSTFDRAGRRQARRPEDAAVRQQVGIPDRARHAGRNGPGENHPGSQRDRRLSWNRSRSHEITRPTAVLRHRSVSTASCVSTICARAPISAISRSIWSTSMIGIARVMKSRSRYANLSRPDCDAAMAVTAKIVEVPPGPPVMSPLVAEIYGIDYEGQVGAAALKVRGCFQTTPDIVDVDDPVWKRPAKARHHCCDRRRQPRLGIHRVPSHRRSNRSSGQT